ncbi:MAG: hypothetical protein AAF599_01600 [Bacteroidota bacterium]
MAFDINTSVMVTERKALVKNSLLGLGVKEEVIHDHTLRALQPVNNNRASYLFPLTRGTDQVKTGELLLTQQDAFALTGIKLIVAKAPATGPGQYMTNGVFFYQYVDPILFNGGAVGGSKMTEAEAMNSFFNGGFIDIKEASTEVIYKLDARKLYYRPENAQNVSATMPETGVLPSTDRISEGLGVYIPSKEVLFSGDQDMNMTISIPGSVDLASLEEPPQGVATFPDHYNLIGAELEGFLIRGGANARCIKTRLTNGVCMMTDTAA